MGDAQALLRFISNDPDENPVEVELSGEGVVPAIAVDPESFDFGVIAVFGDHTLRFKVSNIGDAPLLVNDPLIGGPDPDHFEIAGSLGDPNVDPGKFMYIDVRFKPCEAGVFSAIFTIVSSDPDHREFEIPLSGGGLELRNAIPMVSPFVAVVFIVMLAAAAWILLRRSG